MLKCRVLGSSWTHRFPTYSGHFPLTRLPMIRMKLFPGLGPGQNPLTDPGSNGGEMVKASSVRIAFQSFIDPISLSPS